MNKKVKDWLFNTLALVAIVLLAGGGIWAGLWGVGQVRIMLAHAAGKARMVEAEQSRQVLVITAQAEKDAATAQAQAIATVGAAAQAYPEYREQQFISAFGDALKEGKINQIIYVPTEANIPLLEAGKR